MHSQSFSVTGWGEKTCVQTWCINSSLILFPEMAHFILHIKIVLNVTDVTQYLTYQRQRKMKCLLNEGLKSKDLNDIKNEIKLKET